MAGPKEIGGPAMSPREPTKPPAGIVKPAPPPPPPARTAQPDPWERVAGALESMAHAIRGLTEAQAGVSEGVAAITAALTGNAAVIQKEIDRQARRSEQINALAEEIRSGQAPSRRP